MGRPALRLLLLAAVATAASVWPVLFAGKSFVSPNFGTLLLYQHYPTVPGSQDARTVEVHGSDVGAALWQDVPYSAIEHRSVFRDHALPQWNRYGACGAPLLAQGQSMFGDPLQWLPIAAGGASWAWDAKFVLAKLLFAFGLGLLALELTDDLVAAGICAVAAPFIGFFAYRINHPAFFSLCYSPWILVGALKWRRPSFAGLRRAGRPAASEAARTPLPLSLLLWFVADWALLCSGTVKEAYGLLAILNVAGLILVASSSWRRAGVAAVMLAAFACLSAPLWHPVIALLRSSYITAGTPHANLLPPSLALGLFDEAFFRPFVGGDVFGPSLNIVFLAGCLCALAGWRSLWADPPARATLVLTAAVALLDFGLVPPQLLARIPLVGSIGNLDNLLGCALVVLLAALAALGYAAARRRLPTAEGGWDLAGAALWLVALTVLYSAFASVIPRTTHWDGAFGLIHANGPVEIPAYLLEYYIILLLAPVFGGFFAWVAAGRPQRGRLQRTWAGIGLILLGSAGLWQGLPRSEGGHPGPLSALRVAFPQRANFARPRSAAVDDLLRRAAAAPGRVIGLGLNMFPGWSAYYGLENISGPDAIMSPAYRQLTDAMNLDRRMDWMLAFDPSYLPRQRRFLDFFNVRYYVDQPSQRGDAHAGLTLASTGDLDVYESPTAWPRAFFIARADRGDSAADVVRRLSDGSGAPFALLSSAELAGDARLAALLHGQASATPATNIRLRENSTAFSVNATGPGLAVLSEAYWPGYAHIQVDGRPANALRVNLAFIAVYLPTGGEHRVVVRYFF